MSKFADAVAELQGHYAEQTKGFVTDPARLVEADHVAPCVERFVYGEMDPTRALTTTRSYVPFSPPSLAEKLGAKLEGASPETLNGVRAAIRKAVAAGWLAWVEGEAQTQGFNYKTDRSARDIWEFWSRNLRDPLESIGVRKSWERTVSGLGGDILIGELKALGLTRFLGGSKLRQLGFIYAAAGVFLRIGQTDAYDEDKFREALERYRSMPDRPWKWEDYPISDEALREQVDDEPLGQNAPDPYGAPIEERDPYEPPRDVW